MLNLQPLRHIDQQKGVVVLGNSEMHSSVVSSVEFSKMFVKMEIFSPRSTFQVCMVLFWGGSRCTSLGCYVKFLLATKYIAYYIHINIYSVHLYIHIYIYIHNIIYPFLYICLLNSVISVGER